MRFLSWLWVLVIVLITGCGMKKRAPSFLEEAMVMADSDRSRGERRNSIPPGAMAFAPSPAPSLAAPPPPPEPEPAKPARKLHYSGYARMRTPRASELLDSVEARVAEAGGTVQQRANTRVVARVPVDSFLAVWADVLQLGPVESKELSAADVTEAFQDTELRLRSKKALRERLQALLAEATSELERMQLLEQIHRVTDEIDGLERQFRTLSSLASMSRLTVEATTVRSHARTDLPLGMRWIDGLGPFERRWTYRNKKLPLPDPAGFVRLEKRTWLGESADGALVHGTRWLNDPQGDAGFWIDSIAERLGEEFADGTRSEAGGFVLVRFEEAGNPEPYVWHIGVRVVGKHVQLVSATYPSKDSEERHHADVLAVLTGGAS